MAEDDFSSLIENIKSIKNADQFKSKYISYIRFPFYKNLEKNTRIDFDFPLTVFVGQNGSNKTSSLQALYGAPEGNNLGDFWFSTKIDSIEKSSEGFAPSIIYSWEKNSNGEDLEVLKTRIGFTKGSDYWEPSRPLVKYGMKRKKGGGRNPTIKMDVLYLDFRSILSAFDKYFYFEQPKNLKKSKTRQDYLRNKSIHLKTIIDKGLVQKDCKKNPVNKLPKTISSNELKEISLILGKKYDSGLLIEHRLFRKWGLSILFQDSNLKYSEAFAGSGEMSAAILVHEVLNAKPRSLILLDEPEVSLHPGAQKKLTEFLLRQIKEKKHQVIISTHSPNIVNQLPPEAIKVFSLLPSGKIQVGNKNTPLEAFYFIGQESDSKITIHTEDKLSAEIISSVAMEKGEYFRNLFEVKGIPHGSETLKKYSAVAAQQGENKKFVYLDGDKNTGYKFDPKTELTAADRNEVFLSEKIKEVTGIDVNKLFAVSGRTTQDKSDEYVQFLEHWHNNTLFLPTNTPEELIWDDSYASSLVRNNAGALGDIKKAVHYKDKFEILSKSTLTGFVGSQEILQIQKLFIKNWIEKKDRHYETVSADLDSLMAC